MLVGTVFAFLYLHSATLVFQRSSLFLLDLWLVVVKTFYGTMLLLLQLLLLLQVVTAFVRPTPQFSISSSSFSSSSSLKATAVDAIATLERSQAASVDSIVSAIPDLSTKPDFTWTAANGMVVAGCPVTLDARDAPGPANIAWLSSLCVSSKLCSLTIFNGPLTNVPHLVSRVIVSGDATLQFIVDFRPRAYGAYEMRRPDGTYPGPDELGRKSFEYSGARMEFDTKFGTEAVKVWLSSTIMSLQGASSYDPSPNEYDMLTRGPLYTSVTMPLTDANVATVAAAREQAVKYWLSWLTFVLPVCFVEWCFRVTNPCKRTSRPRWLLGKE